MEAASAIYEAIFPLIEKSSHYVWNLILILYLMPATTPVISVYLCVSLSISMYLRMLPSLGRCGSHNTNMFAGCFPYLPAPARKSLTMLVCVCVCVCVVCVVCVCVWCVTQLFFMLIPITLAVQWLRGSGLTRLLHDRQVLERDE